MSTRCQVRVNQLNCGWDQSVTLYHHCDGYPSNMLPLIASSYKPDWEHGRAGKVASFLCAVDPGSFEPESGHDLHGDIEWYYVLNVKNNQDGTLGEKPTWEIEVYRPKDGFYKLDNPTVANLTLVSTVPLSKATKTTGNKL